MANTRNIILMVFTVSFIMLPLASFSMSFSNTGNNDNLEFMRDFIMGQKSSSGGSMLSSSFDKEYEEQEKFNQAFNLLRLIF